MNLCDIDCGSTRKFSTAIFEMYFPITKTYRLLQVIIICTLFIYANIIDRLTAILQVIN